MSAGPHLCRVWGFPQVSLPWQECPHAFKFLFPSRNIASHPESTSPFSCYGLTHERHKARRNERNDDSLTGQDWRVLNTGSQRALVWNSHSCVVYSESYLTQTVWEFECGTWSFISSLYLSYLDVLETWKSAASFSWFALCCCGWCLKFVWRSQSILGLTTVPTFALHTRSPLYLTINLLFDGEVLHLKVSVFHWTGWQMSLVESELCVRPVSRSVPGTQW